MRAQFVFIVRVWLPHSEALNSVTSLGLKVREGEVSENGLMAQGGGGREQFLGPPLCASGAILPLIPSLPVCVAWVTSEGLGCRGTWEVWSHCPVLAWPPVGLCWWTVNTRPCCH